MFLAQCLPCQAENLGLWSITLLSGLCKKFYMGSCLLHAHPQSMDPSVGLHMPPHTPHVAYPWQVNPKLPYVPYIPHCAKSLQLCLTLCDPMNCSLPDSSVHGDSSGKNTAVGCHTLLQGTCPTQGLNPGFPHFRWILYHLSH